jgi:aspartyl-tRNA(Asn)/glutamyl-tRNA(Gln) amidotransferase subunit A
MKTLLELVEDLAEGRTTSRELVEGCLARIEDDSGEGARVFISHDAEAARADADHQDDLRQRGRAPSPFGGIPTAYKDLFDVAGEVTRAGSVVLDEAPAAVSDCPVVGRMRGAGFVQMGRTNMTEFAFSGVGINPHYGTPACPYDRANRRVPGGSSSGTAISITDDMAAVALGSDTGGSCRIPAALNGIVGYKPTAWRVPIDGVYPLSFSLDSIGPLGNSVACCAAIDAILSQDWSGAIAPRGVNGLRLGALQNVVLDKLDDEVALAYEKSLSALSDAGALIEDFVIDELDELRQINAKGGLAAAEAYGWHKEMLASDGDRYDPRVGSRILGGQAQSAADYLDLLTARARLTDAADAVTHRFDAVVLPACALIAPRESAFAEEKDYARINMMLLRNTAVGNFLDRCAISLPCHRPGEAPVGFMLMGEHGADEALFSVAQAVEGTLNAVRGA